MVRKSYFYLGEQNIGIDGPKELLARIDRNFEETPTDDNHDVGIVKIEEGNIVEFSRDRSKPYLVTRRNITRDYPGTDFLRYGVCVRTIWKKNPLNYEVENFLPLDETGALSCFKKIYYRTHASKNKALIHGSLVNVGGKGIFIVGRCWSGKTSLTFGFLEQIGGQLVSDGNVLVSYENGHMVGYYIPRPVFVRFHSISRSRSLSHLLDNPSDSESIQPFDKEAIEEIIAGRKYDLDAGLNISRKRFAESIGIKTIPVLRIDKVIYTEFSAEDLPKIGSSSTENSYVLLLEREFPKTTTVSNIKHQREIERPKGSIIRIEWVEGLEKLKVSFDAKRDLTKGLLEDLICFH